MTLVRPATDPSKSHYTQYYPQPADSPEAASEDTSGMNDDSNEE